MLQEQSKLSEIENLFEENRDALLEEFFTLLKFKSISTESEYKKDVLSCADWLQTQMENAGFQVEQWPTSGHPTLFATMESDNKDAPTILFYGHYDVQPVDPLNEWKSEPFEPEIRDGKIFARGAQDNKGQLFYTFAALRALKKRDGKLPVNVKLCIEGEEEAGSKGLFQVVEQKANELKADYLAIVDLGIKGLQTPSVSLGTRGLITMDMEVVGSKVDLHSGFHGGIAYNPIHALTEILASLRDDEGKVTVPGFYDGIDEFTNEEKSGIDFSFDDEEYLREFGKFGGGENLYSPMESNWLRPTLEVNGISGGYSGDGFKTVIPAKAIAKISCRLVPGQEPKKVGILVKEYIESLAPESVSVKVHLHEGGGPAVKTSPLSKGVQAIAKAYSEVYAKSCVHTLEGGSIPVTPALQKTSGASIVFMGLGLDTDLIHAPNEHFSVDRLKKGFVSIIRFVQIMGESE